MAGIETLNFLSSPFEKYNPKETKGLTYKKCPKAQNFVGFFEGKKSGLPIHNPPSPGGVLPYIIYTGMCHPTGS